MNDEMLKLSKAIRESIRSLVEIQKYSEIDVKLTLSEIIDNLIESQAHISTIQGSYQDILNINEQLRKKIVQYEQWTEDESKYEPLRFSRGGTVMIPKELNTASKTKEWYCKHCFDNKKKVQLQPNIIHDRCLSCPECKETIPADLY